MYMLFESVCIDDKPGKFNTWLNIFKGHLMDTDTDIYILHRVFVCTDDPLCRKSRNKNGAKLCLTSATCKI